MTNAAAHPSPRPRHRSRPRLMAIWLPAVMIGTLAFLGLYHAMFGVRQADLRRWRETARQIPVQQLPRELETDFNLRFVPSFSARTLMQGVPLQAMQASVGGESIVSAGGYVFVSEDVKVAYGRSFIDVREQRPRDAIEVMARLAARLREQGIHFMAVPVPAKSTMLPTELESEYAAASRGPMLNTGHAKWIEALRAADVEVFDPTDALWAKREEAPLFFTSDTHWTQQAMSMTAQALRPRVLEIVGETSPRVALERRTIPFSRRGDVTRAASGVEDIQGTLTQVLVDGRPAQFEDGPVLVIGDSYAGIFGEQGAGFAQVLAAETGLAVRSEAEFGVQASRMSEQVDRPGALAGKRLVLLVFSLRKIQCNEWRGIEERLALPGGG